MSCFHIGPENAGGQLDRFEDVTTGDSQLQTPVTVNEQHMLKAAADKQDGNPARQRMNVQHAFARCPHDTVGRNSQNARVLMRMPEDVRITADRACKTGAPSAKDQRLSQAS